MWSRHGNSLYYVSQRTVFEAKLHIGIAFKSEPPAPVFTATGEIGAFDVAPHGQKVLVLPDAAKDFLSYNVVVNWQAKTK